MLHVKEKEQNYIWITSARQCQTASDGRFRLVLTHSIRGDWKVKDSSCGFFCYIGIYHTLQSENLVWTISMSNSQIYRLHEDNVKTDTPL